MFSKVSQPYLAIFRGYLHGLWAGWANVGLAICHRLEPMQWTLSVPRDIVLNWPRPAYICQYHHQWSWVLGPPFIFSPLFSYPRSCHIEAFNKYQEVRLFPENYPSTHWPYQYKIPSLSHKKERGDGGGCEQVKIFQFLFLITIMKSCNYLANRENILIQKFPRANQ